MTQENLLKEALNANDIDDISKLLVSDKELAEKYMDTVLLHENFPTIVNSMLSAIQSMHQSNNASTNQVHITLRESCERFSKIIEEQGSRMDKEERAKIYEHILHLNHEAREHDKDNKRFLAKVGMGALGITAIVGGLLINKKMDLNMAKKIWDEL